MANNQIDVNLIPNLPSTKITGLTAGNSIAILQDRKTSGTGGQSLTQNTWTQRNLNTEVADANNIVTLGTNDFTLGTGTYVIEWWMNARQGASNHRTRLHDGTSVVDYGHNIFLSAGELLCMGMTQVTIASGTKTYRIDHWTDGAGVSTGGASSQATEIYGTVKITKVA